MRIDIRRIFLDIKTREEENKDAKAFIEEKEKECTEATRAPRDLIEWNDMVINMFKNTQISVSLKEVLDEIANIIDKDRKRLTVDVEASALSQLFMTKGNWLAWVFNIRDENRADFRNGDMIVTINLDGEEIAKFIVPFSPKAVQNDGRHMYGHLDFVELKEGDPCYSKDKKLCKAVITDKENIMLNYTIRQLLAAQGGNSNPWIPGVVLQAILNINDRECGKSVDVMDKN